MNSLPSPPKLVVFQPAQLVPCMESQTGSHKQGIMLEDKHPVAPSKAIFTVVSPAQNFCLTTAFVQTIFRTGLIFCCSSASNTIVEKLQSMPWLIGQNMTVLCV